MCGSDTTVVTVPWIAPNRASTKHPTRQTSGALVVAFFSELPVFEVHFLSDEQMARVVMSLSSYFNLTTSTERDYSIEIDPRKLQPERIDVLAALGFNRMNIGIQDFDPLVQEAVNRIQTEDETRVIVRRARERDFQSISFDLIYGLPKQTVRLPVDPTDRRSRHIDRVAYGLNQLRVSRPLPCNKIDVQMTVATRLRTPACRPGRTGQQSAACNQDNTQYH